MIAPPPLPPSQLRMLLLARLRPIQGLRSADIRTSLADLQRVGHNTASGYPRDTVQGGGFGVGPFGVGAFGG